MIPNSDLLNIEIDRNIESSKNHFMNIDEKHIDGYVDNIDAMKQVIYKILNTERYQYIIYSWDYGIELNDLLGEPTLYVCAELERRISEALVQDDRINSVSDFSFDYTQKGIIIANFTVNTIFGNLEIEKVVNY